MRALEQTELGERLGADELLGAWRDAWDADRRHAESGGFDERVVAAHADERVHFGEQRGEVRHETAVAHAIFDGEGLQRGELGIGHHGTGNDEPAPRGVGGSEDKFFQCAETILAAAGGGEDNGLGTFGAWWKWALEVFQSQFVLGIEDVADEAGFVRERRRKLVSSDGIEDRAVAVDENLIVKFHDAFLHLEGLPLAQDLLWFI